MRRVVLFLSCLGMSGVVGGCELLVGIKDKAMTGDASTAGDAGDGGNATDDPSVPCSQQPPFLFCDDFDTEIEAGDTWLWDIPLGGGTIEMDPSEFKTPPRSVKATVPSPGAQGQLGVSVGSISNGYRLAFDLRVDATDLSSIPQVGVAQAYRNTGNDQLSVNYVLGPGAHCMLQIFEGTTGTLTNVPLLLPPLQTWTRIVLVYDSAQGMSVIEDGKMIATSALAHGAPGDTSIIVGAVYSNPPGSSLVLEIDDVVMRGQ